MDELEGRWEAVCKLSVSKQDRLEAALQQVLVQTQKPKKKKKAERWTQYTATFLKCCVSFEYTTYYWDSSFKFDIFPAEITNIHVSLKCNFVEKNKHTRNKQWLRNIYLRFDPSFYLSLFLSGWEVRWSCPLFYGASYWGREDPEIWADTRGGGKFTCLPQTARGQYNMIFYHSL